MPSHKEAMDVDPSTSKPSTSSDLMRLIDDANRVVAVPETGQWAVRGWPKGMAMFHTNNCQCCNEYVAHTVKACKDGGINLPRQEIGDAITTAWPELMRDLERNAEARAANDYEALEVDIVRLKTKLESSQSALASERSRVERRDETIRDLRHEIEALKRPHSTLSTTTSSTRPGAQASSSAGPSSRPKAPLPARAHSGLAARISQPGLSSRIDDRPAVDRFDDPPDDHTSDTPQSGVPIPKGWSDPGIASDDSMWDQMRDPDEPQKPLSKKRKKRGITYEPCGLLAVHEKVTREYLARSSTHTVDDEALTAELRSARHAFAREQAELAKNMVTPTPQFADLTVRTKYPGEGEPLPHGDSPIPVTGRLPRPLGYTTPRIAQWVDVCPLEDERFITLHELAKNTPPAERTREMNITFRRVQAQRRVDNPKPDRFGIGVGTAGDIVTILRGWQHNPEGVPAPIRGESDGTLNTTDIDVWMWMRKLSPKSRPANATLKAPLVSLFSEPGRFNDLVEARECLTPQGDTLRSSITTEFPIGGRDTSTIPMAELAKWLARYGGITPNRVPRIEAYVARLLSKKAYNPAAIEGQQRMTKGATRAAKRARTKASSTTISAAQLDRELAAARPPSTPPDPAAAAAWHLDNGLALPDHLETEAGPNTRGTGSSTEVAPAELAGASQPETRPPPAPYTDVPMADVEEILDYEPSS